jgi:hypothetical protein
MRVVSGFTLTLAALLVPAFSGAQEAARKIDGGGISVAGWTGRIDDSETKAGQALNNAKLAMDGAALQVTTGPAVVYWNLANNAAGYDKAALVAAGKLKSTDGIYGIRFAHNTEALVTGLAVAKN